MKIELHLPHSFTSSDLELLRLNLCRAQGIVDVSYSPSKSDVLSSLQCLIDSISGHYDLPDQLPLIEVSENLTGQRTGHAAN